MSSVAIEALIVLAARYGPGLVTELIDLFKKPNASLDDLRAVFAKVQPYSAFGIPDVAPANVT